MEQQFELFLWQSDELRISSGPGRRRPSLTGQQLHFSDGTTAANVRDYVLSTIVPLYGHF